MSLFHSTIENWFTKNLGEPTEVQHLAWKEIKAGNNTLIAAPTGSGKTLAAFLSAIDDLVKQSLEFKLENATQVVYISPLKALSNDIERNLNVPLSGIQKELEEQGLFPPGIRVIVRTGDTPQAERTEMIKNPPHILVTTPESLYLMLTSVNGRKILSTVQTVIVDEIHALVGDKRGSHLALSLERLQVLTKSRLKRIGISATQKPIEQVAEFLTGTHGKEYPAVIVNAGHKRKLDIAIEVPPSPLTAVMANEVWGEIYQKLEELILSHKTTLIFVNTRRLAERLAHTLTERLGEDAVTAHHGSMSKDHRFDAEQRLKNGSLRALVATASLELGIDIGSVDLVCQVGSPRSIAAFLQRVGRSGHSVKGTPKGRLFPLNLDELAESVAILDAVKRGELDKIIIPDKPLDILAQQMVAEVSCDEYKEDDLFDLVKKAYPYRNLERKEFDEIVTMLSDGFATKRGRRSAYLHRDMVNDTIRARKGAKLTAIVSGGAIPDNFDYDVILEPSGTYLGTLNEDFAIESMSGDIFQLGNTSWRILNVETGKVRVEDAGGMAPTIPFWLGEAPGRTVELSQAVSRLRAEISEKLGSNHDLQIAETVQTLTNDLGLSASASEQLVNFYASAQAALGVMPTQETLVMERFFDEAGDMHLVIHSPFGSRMNRAWGLSLRKRFCKKFNFELQAAATEDAIILSLGSTHSFPLEEVFQYLNAQTVRSVLIQALLDSPMFEIRWRWNASRALAVLRRRAGKKVPPQIQRMNSEDLIALVFPDQLACFENIQGEREVPDHPLVNQTIHDCLYEAMDIERLENLLRSIKAGELNLVAKDLKEPSPFAHGILNARPYAFLDDAPLEERRTNAVKNRRWMDPEQAKDLGKLDEVAIEAVKKEAFPEAENYDELHDALVLSGFINEKEGEENNWKKYFNELIIAKRATVVQYQHIRLWAAVERLPQLLKVYPSATLNPLISIPEKIQSAFPENQNSLSEIIRGRLEILGPVTASSIAETMGLPLADVDMALSILENEGFVFRGQFNPEEFELEWCERRLLARIHRYTLKKLRSEVQPVNAADFMRFLFQWQQVETGTQSEGPQALEKVLEQLEGYEAQAAAWESDILTMRVNDYDHHWLDVLCLSGKFAWGRFRINNNSKNSGPVKTTPVSIVSRPALGIWKAESTGEKLFELSHNAKKIQDVLSQYGAMFFNEITEKTGLLRGQTEEAMNELVSCGLLTSDSFTGLRALLLPAKYSTQAGRTKSNIVFSMEQAGRWSLLSPAVSSADISEKKKSLETIARTLLKRYGVVFRRLAEKENLTPRWRELIKIYRLMEARGEIRGGRFVEGMYGEQFALPETISLLRKIRKNEKSGRLISISASDPLNLTGVITPGKRVSALYGNRILYMDGIPLAVKDGKEIALLPAAEIEELKGREWQVRQALVQRNIPPRLRAYLGKGIG